MKTKMTESQIERLLRMLHEGMSDRSIARQLGVSHPVVGSYRRKAEESGLSYQELIGGDFYLPDFFSKEGGHRPVDEQKYKVLEPLLEGYAKQLSGKYGRYDLCHMDYCRKVSQELRYGYTTFKKYVQAYTYSKEYTYHLEHIPGEEMQVDFAGDAIPIVNKVTGEVYQAHLLICVLSYSQLVYVAPMLDMSVTFMYNALADALIYFGGVPKKMVSDNMKQYVIRADRYEPSYNNGAVQFSDYYNIDLEGCRVRRPRDKALSERAVQSVYDYIHARIMTGDGSGTPLEIGSESQLRYVVQKYLDEMNNKIQSSDGLSRRQRFLMSEKDALHPLPKNKLHIWHEKHISRLDSSYHVVIGKEQHHYSVPHIHVGKSLILRYNAECVVIYDDSGRKIWVHPRKMMKGWSTEDSHMPDSHKAYKEISGRNAHFYIRACYIKAEEIGRWVEKMLKSAKYPEHHYKQCEGVLSMIKRNGIPAVRNACAELDTIGIYSYSSLKETVSRILKEEAGESAQDPSASVIMPANDDVRGPEHYS